MNWIKMHWAQSGNVWDYHNDDFFYIDLSNLITTDKNPFECSLQAIQRITQRFPEPYYLMLSGGLDSQAMLDAWIASKVNFIPMHFTYNKHWNKADTLKILDYCNHKNINLTIKDINVFDFYEKELYSYSKNYVCNSPHITVYMKMADTIKDGTVIFSGNPLQFYLASRGKNFIDYTILGLHRYGLKSGRPVVPFFFLETPEQSFAFKTTEIEANGVAKENNITGYQIKTLHYLLSGFDVYPTEKLSGFERYKQYYDQFPELVTKQERLKFLIRGKSLRVYDAILRYQLYEINKYSDRVQFFY